MDGKTADNWVDSTGYMCCTPPYGLRISDMRKVNTNVEYDKLGRPGRWTPELESMLYTLRTGGASFPEIARAITEKTGKSIGESSVGDRVKKMMDEGRWHG
jgi:23S rRNA G2445 N2-methylase RlmL